MKDKKLMLFTIALTLVLIFLGYHYTQYAYIRIFYGPDAPFEDWTVFSAQYYWINDLMRLVASIDFIVFEDGSFRLTGCLPGQLCS